jgi:hypothetical protein
MINFLVQLAERFTAGMAAIVAALFNNLAVAIAPIAPSGIFGYAVYDATMPTMGHGMALAIAIPAAFSLEATGFTAFHVALERKGWVPKLLPLGYLLIGTGALVFIKGGDAVLGIVMFLLVALSYASLAMRRDASAQKAERTTEQTIAIEERKRQQELDHQLKLARLEAQKEVKLSETSQKLSAPEETFQKVSETVPTDWRKLTAKHHAMIRSMSRSQVTETFGVTEKTAGAWHERLGVQ